MKYVVIVYYPDETQDIFGMYETIDEAYEAIDGFGHPEFDYAVYQHV